MLYCFNVRLLENTLVAAALVTVVLISIALYNAVPSDVVLVNVAAFTVALC